MNAVNVPCGPIHDIGEAFEDAQVKHLHMTRPATHPVMGEIELVRSPINLSGFDHPDRFHHAGPDPGEHSEAILKEVGYDDDAIRQMKSEGSVA